VEPSLLELLRSAVQLKRMALAVEAAAESGELWRRYSMARYVKLLVKPMPKDWADECAQVVDSYGGPEEFMGMAASSGRTTGAPVPKDRGGKGKGAASDAAPQPAAATANTAARPTVGTFAFGSPSFGMPALALGTSTRGVQQDLMGSGIAGNGGLAGRSGGGFGGGSRFIGGGVGVGGGAGGCGCGGKGVEDDIAAGKNERHNKMGGGVVQGVGGEVNVGIYGPCGPAQQPYQPPQFQQQRGHGGIYSGFDTEGHSTFDQDQDEIEDEIEEDGTGAAAPFGVPIISASALSAARQYLQQKGAGSGWMGRPAYPPTASKGGASITGGLMKLRKGGRTSSSTATALFR